MTGLFVLAAVVLAVAVVAAYRTRRHRFDLSYRGQHRGSGRRMSTPPATGRGTRSGRRGHLGQRYELGDGDGLAWQARRGE